jgi:GGDEF domain-containing protein
VADKLGGLTLSIGGGLFRPSAHQNPRDFFHDIDSALYAAKQGGKNCVRLKV